MRRFAIVAKVPIRVEVEAETAQEAVETWWKNEGRHYAAVEAPDVGTGRIRCEVIEAYESNDG